MRLSATKYEIGFQNSPLYYGILPSPQRAQKYFYTIYFDTLAQDVKLKPKSSFLHPNLNAFNHSVVIYNRPETEFLDKQQTQIWYKSVQKTDKFLRVYE
jgi:hypothetical protein